MALFNNEASQEKIVCESCDREDPAQTRCKECGMFLCRYCTEFHKRSLSMKYHELLTIEQLRSGDNKPQNFAEKIRCAKHKDEVLKLFCKTCQTTICRDCTIVDHRQHEYGFVEDVAAEEKQKIYDDLGLVKHRRERLAQGIEDLKKFKESLDGVNASVISDISQLFDEIVKVVETRKRELVEKATSLTNKKQNKIDEQVEVLETALASCESSIKFTEQAFKNGNDVQILSIKTFILHPLAHLKGVKDETKPCVGEDLVLAVPSSSVQETTQTLLKELNKCDVITSDPDNCYACFEETEDIVEKVQDHVYM